MMTFRVIIVALTTLVSVLFCSSPLSAESKKKRPNINYFEGSWHVKSELSSLLILGFGKPTAESVNRPNSSFVFYSNHNGENVVHRFGHARYKGTTVSGNFEFAASQSAPDNVGALGIGTSGKFALKVGPDSIRTLSGTFISKDGTKTKITAERVHTDIKNTTFVLGIEPTKRKVYSVGELLTFKVTAALRGPAPVDSEQPDLVVAFDPAVTEITVLNSTNITGCSVEVARTPAQVVCSFGVLGPKAVEAKVFVQVRVPAALAGDRLSAAVGVEPIDPDEATENDIEPLTVKAATRVSRVKIKKSNQSPCQQYVGSWTTNSGNLILNSDDTYTAIDNGTVGSGIWKCQVESAGTYLYLGTDSPNGPFYPNKFLFSNDGTHFEGTNFFGGFYSGNKDP